MPVTLQEVDALADQKVIDQAVEFIDREMLNVQRVKDNTYGEPGQRYWKVLGKGSLSIGEKKELTRIYLDAGWPRVEVGNSDDPPGKERAGIWFVMLYESPKADSGLISLAEAAESGPYY